MKPKPKKSAAKAKAFEIEQVSTQQAAAIERESKALADNPALIQLRAVEKWNGTMPTFIGGGAPIPFLSLPK